MNKLIFVLLISVLPGFSYSQGWELTFGASADLSNSGRDVIQTQDSCFVVVGSINCVDYNCSLFIKNFKRWTSIMD